MEKEIKFFAVAFLICLVGQGMFWTGFFVNRVEGLWMLYVGLCVFSILAVGVLLMTILGE